VPKRKGIGREKADLGESVKLDQGASNPRKRGKEK